jgi:hypothetical protein
VSNGFIEVLLLIQEIYNLYSLIAIYMQSVEARQMTPASSFTNSSPSISSSSTSLSSLTSSASGILFDSSNVANKRVMNKEAIRKNLEELQMRKKVICKQIDDLTKQVWVASSVY